MTNYLGERLALLLGNAHEMTSGNDTKLTAEWWKVDLRANALGRRIAAMCPSCTEYELANLVQAAVDAGMVKPVAP